MNLPSDSIAEPHVPEENYFTAWFNKRLPLNRLLPVKLLAESTTIFSIYGSEVHTPIKEFALCRSLLNLFFMIIAFALRNMV
jgi:hypothetical protein